MTISSHVVDSSTVSPVTGIHATPEAPAIAADHAAIDVTVTISNDVQIDGSTVSPVAAIPATPGAPEITAPQSALLLKSTGLEDVEFMNKSKSRFKRRLLARWDCDTIGHTHCYVNVDNVHIALNQEAVEAWVSALHNGEATLLSPPPGLLQSISPSSHLDAASVRSHISTVTVQYQRPYRWQRNPSLTDLRSSRNRLGRAISSSTVSSGVPGIGYLSGKGIKWVGFKIVDSLHAMEMFRRRWVIARLLKHMHEIPEQQRGAWIVKRERKMDRAIEDIMELASDGYKSKYRRIARTQSTALSIFDYVDDPTILEHMQRFRTKITLLNLATDDNQDFVDFARDLREILLQDPLVLMNELLVVEVFSQIVLELVHGLPGAARTQGFHAIRRLYPAYRATSHRQSSQNMEALARRVFVPDTEVHELAAATRFYAAYADDTPHCQMHLLESSGIPAVSRHIRNIGKWEHSPGTMFELLKALVDFSVLPWCSAVLSRLDIYPTFVSQIVTSQSSIESKMYPPLFLLSINAMIKFLRNQAVLGGTNGRQVVVGAATKELRQVLPHLELHVRTGMGELYTADSRELLAKILV